MKISKSYKSLIVLAIFACAFTISVRENAVASSNQPSANAELDVASPSTPAADSTQPPPRTTLLFTGDINLGRCVAKQSITFEDYTFPFRFVADKLRAADLTIGSLDGTISDQSPPMTCPQSMNLIAPPKMVQGLQFAGFDLITVATNHIKDCGDKGFRCDDQAFLDTLANLSDAGILTVGGGRDLAQARAPVIIERNGLRFAFLAVDEVDPRVWASESSAGVAPISAAHIASIDADIAAAKQSADVVIVLPQWGIEYAAMPEHSQRQWAAEFIHAGATLVIGNGPHTVQPSENIDNGVALYALGNFVFDQEQNYRREGVAAEFVFDGSQLTSWKLLPLHINFFSYQPQWADGVQAQIILQRAAPLPP